ncbi:MAG: hypothetical protein U5K54_23500 [Cytophagales bacterium]|nr:hypothetical protein [Cytophagales bacterium]
MKKIVSLVLFVLASTFAFSQYETIKKTARPSIPGTFMVDLGVN